MPRKAIERHPFFPYHVYNRSIDKNFYPLDLSKMWTKCCDLLKILTTTFDAKIHAFVLMSNHYHLLISTPSENIDSCMRYFQTELSKWITKNTKSGIYCFYGRYQYSIIKNSAHYLNVYRYVYQNPLRAGLCEHVENYNMSTINEVAGQLQSKHLISMHDFNDVLPNTQDKLLVWLNTSLRDEDLLKVRRGLRRSIYTPPLQPKKTQKAEICVGR